MYARIHSSDLSRLDGTFSCKSTAMSTLKHGNYRILHSVRYFIPLFLFPPNLDYSILDTYIFFSGNLTLNKPHPSENPHFCPISLLCFLIKFVYVAWPGMRECVPRYKRGIWCCRFYTVLVDGSGFGDICWALAAIERINQNGQAPWQQFMNPLLPGP